MSYPTIRSKLDEINKTLDRAEAMPPPAPVKEESGAASAGAADEARRGILAQVSSGELPAAQALQKLRDLQGGK